MSTQIIHELQDLKYLEWSLLTGRENVSPWTKDAPRQYRKFSSVSTRKVTFTKAPGSSTGVRYARLPSLMQKLSMRTRTDFSGTNLNRPKRSGDLEDHR